MTSTRRKKRTARSRATTRARISRWTEHGTQGSWAHGLMGSWAHRLMGSWAHRLMGSWAHGLMGSWAHGLMGSWAHRLMGSWAHGLYCEPMRLCAYEPGSAPVFPSVTSPGTLRARLRRSTNAHPSRMVELGCEEKQLRSSSPRPCSRARDEAQKTHSTKPKKSIAATSR